MIKFILKLSLQTLALAAGISFILTTIFDKIFF